MNERKTISGNDFEKSSELLKKIEEYRKQEESGMFPDESVQEEPEVQDDPSREGKGIIPEDADPDESLRVPVYFPPLVKIQLQIYCFITGNNMSKTIVKIVQDYLAGKFREAQGEFNLEGILKLREKFQKGGK